MKTIPSDILEQINRDTIADAFVALLHFALTDSTVLTASATHNGWRFSNAGATGTVTFTLPAVATNLEFEFVRVADYAVRLDPDGSEAIAGGGAGKYLELGAVGSTVRLGRMADGTWYVMSGYGTISFES